MAHFADREPPILGLVSFTQSLLIHTPVSVQLFVMMTGFTMHWGHSSFSPFARRHPAEGGCDRAQRVAYELFGWYMSRCSRLVVLTWISMIMMHTIEIIYVPMLARSKVLHLCFTFTQTWRLWEEDLV
ncbi:MAG: hypothetical protein SGPRY_013931, partial [Prymnesium sp.]